MGAPEATVSFGAITKDKDLEAQTKQQEDLVRLVSSCLQAITRQSLSLTRARAETRRGPHAAAGVCSRRRHLWRYRVPLCRLQAAQKELLPHGSHTWLPAGHIASVRPPAVEAAVLLTSF